MADDKKTIEILLDLKAKAEGDAFPKTLKGLSSVKAQIDELKKSGKLTTDQLKELEGVEKGLGGATEKLIGQKVAMAELREEVGHGVKSQTLMNDLFDKSQGKFGQLKGAATTLGGALAGGLAVGTMIAKKAGVDFTETLQAIEEWSKKAAVAVNTGISNAMEWLAGKFEAIAKFFHLKGAEDFFGNIKRGLDGQAEAQAKLAKEQEHDEYLRQQRIKSTNQHIAQIEREIALHGETKKRVAALGAEKEKLAQLEKKTDEEQYREHTATLQAIKDQENEAFDLEAEHQAKLGEIRHNSEEKQKQDALDLANYILRVKQEYADEVQKNEEQLEAKRESIRQDALQNIHAMEAKAATVRIADLKRQAAQWAGVWAGDAEMQLKIKEWLAEQIQQIEQENVKTTVAGINAGLSAAAEAFPQNKEVQIAQTVMATYESATNAYKSAAAIPYVGFILGPAAAAAAIIAGFKNVQAIENQPEPTKKQVAAPSFDDPVNDAAARFAGRQSARDVVNHLNNGFREQLMSGTSGFADGNTSSAAFGGGSSSRSIVVNINGSFATPAPEFTRVMSRELRKYDQKIETKVRGSRSARVK